MSVVSDKNTPNNHTSHPRARFTIFVCECLCKVPSPVVHEDMYELIKPLLRIATVHFGMHILHSLDCRR